MEYQSRSFDISLSSGALRFLSSMDELIKLGVDGITPSDMNIKRMGLVEQLRGWTIVRKERGTTARFDSYYSHQNIEKKFRSLNEVQFYVKYGFLPDKGDQSAVECSSKKKKKKLSILDQIEMKFIKHFDAQECLEANRISPTDEFLLTVATTIKEQVEFEKNSMRLTGAAETRNIVDVPNTGVDAVSPSMDSIGQQTTMATNQGDNEDPDYIFLEPIEKGFSPVRFLFS